jgi:agmatinase
VVPQTRPQGKVRQTLSPRELRRRGIPALVESLDPGVSYYVTFDIDALDPMYAPGTSTPQPGGLTFVEAKELLVTIASQRDCVGIDLVEINPDCDHNDITAITGIELLLAFLGARFGRRSAASGRDDG